MQTYSQIFGGISYSLNKTDIYNISGKADLDYELVDTSFKNHLHPSLLCLANRHNPKVNSSELLTKNDNEIKQKYLRPSAAVLMFEWEIKEAEKLYGAEKGLEIKYKALKIISPILSRLGG